jgi:LacI family transcriptional regulator
MSHLGYKPNRLARQLARKTTRAIAITIPNSSDLFFAELAHSVEDVAYAAGFNLILCDSNRALERELSYFPVLDERRIDGILLITSGLESAQLHSLVNDTPLVILDREIPGAQFDTVVFDNFGAGLQATQHLLEHGHTRVACITGPRQLAGARERVAGYRQAHAQRGLAVDETLIGWADYTFAGGLVAAQALLAARPRPTAIFTSNDEMGVAVVQAARELGIAVPQALAVASIGDSFLGTIVSPKLTTVTTSISDMGRLGAKMLLERVQGTAPAAFRHVVLKTELKVRESCGCGAGRAAGGAAGRAAASVAVAPATA